MLKVGEFKRKKMMSYYISKVVELSFEDAVVKVKKELAKVGFGKLVGT